MPQISWHSQLTPELPHTPQRLPSDRPHDLSPLTDVNWVAAQLDALADAPPPRARRAPALWPPANAASEGGGLPPAMAGLSLRSPRVLRSPLEPAAAAPLLSQEEAEPLPGWGALGKRLEVLRLPIAAGGD